MSQHNAAIVAHANENGLTINLSANNLAHADELADLGIAPVVSLVPEGSPRRMTTPAGRKVILCPAQHRDDVMCLCCRLCARADRKVVIGFSPHGAQRRPANRIAAD